MVARKKEMESLEWDLQKGESQFIAVYGRRRVGKTYLVRQFFKDKFAFYHTGLQKGNLKDQLDAFRDSLIKYGYAECPPLTSWERCSSPASGASAPTTMASEKWKV